MPDDIPNQFDIDVTELMIGSAIRVSELALKEGVRILTPGDAVPGSDPPVQERFAHFAHELRAGDHLEGTIAPQVEEP